MLGSITELLSYGGGALGIVGVVYFIIKHFLSKDEDEEIIKQNQKEKEKTIKQKQKEINKQEQELNKLNKKSDEIKGKIDKSMEDLQKEKEEIEKSDSVEGTVNMIEEEW